MSREEGGVGALEGLEGSGHACLIFECEFVVYFLFMNLSVLMLRLDWEGEGWGLVQAGGRCAGALEVRDRGAERRGEAHLAEGVLEGSCLLFELAPIL